jgi:hypothetical protein
MNRKRNVVDLFFHSMSVMSHPNFADQRALLVSFCGMGLRGTAKIVRFLIGRMILKCRKILEMKRLNLRQFFEA